MHQIIDWFQAIPVGASDYPLRGVFPWLDSMNDWVDQSWLGQPLSTGTALVLFFLLMIRR